MSKNEITFGILGAGFMGARTYPRALRAAAQIAASLGIRIRVTHIYVRDKSKHDAVGLETGIENVTDNLDEVIASCDDLQLSAEQCASGRNAEGNRSR